MQSPWTALNLREIVNIQQVEQRSESFLIDDDGRCTVMLQTLEDDHPIYLVIGSRKELVTTYVISALPLNRFKRSPFNVNYTDLRF